MARRDRKAARNPKSTRDVVERAALALLTALALSGALIAAFADAFRRRRTRAADDGSDLEAVPEGDLPNRAPFDREAAGVGGSRDPKGFVLRFAERRRWAWLGRALQVMQRYKEIHGDEVAASVTLYAFLTLFPLLLVAIAVLGFIQANSGDFAARVVEDLGLQGEAASQVRDALDTASKSRKATSVIGLLGLLWSALGFTAALRIAFNQAWQVEARGWKDRLLGLAWFAGAGILFAAGAAVTASLNWLPGPATVFGAIVSLLLSFGFFMWTSRILPNVDVGWRPLVPGAVVGAIGLEALKYLGAFIVPRAVASASALYGTLGVVFAVLAWLLFFGRLVVYAAVVDVVMHEAGRATVVAAVEVPATKAATRKATRSGASLPDAIPAVDDPSENGADARHETPAGAGDRRH